MSRCVYKTRRGGVKMKEQASKVIDYPFGPGEERMNEKQRKRQLRKRGNIYPRIACSGQDSWEAGGCPGGSRKKNRRGKVYSSTLSEKGRWKSP